MPLNKSSCLVFDVKAFSLQTKKTEPFGYAVLPLITSFQQR